MFDASSPFEPPAPSIETIRANGGVAASWRLDEQTTRLVSLEERGGWRAKFPEPDPHVEAVLINTGGGILGGDRAQFSFVVGDGAHVTAATQSAERIYRTLGPRSEIATRATLGADAHFAWMPQETILFNGARLARSLDIDLPASATLLAAECIVFGRAAMGETIRAGSITDNWRVRRDGQLVFAEATKIGGDMAAQLARPAIGNGAVAVATLLYVNPDAESRLDGARAALGQPMGRAALSAWNGFLVARFTALSSAHIRADIIRIATYLSGRSMPRVWNC